MSAPSTILVATDFSEHARHAAERAALLAEETGSVLTLMHVLPGGAIDELRLWLGEGHASEQRLHDNARERLHELAASLRSKRRIELRTVHTIGAAVDDVLIEASTLDAGLLVVGARGAGFLRHLVLGSTAERLLRRTLRPVLVVRQAAQATYRRVLLALDFSAWSAELASLARQVAPDARLVLVNAFQVPFEGRLQFADVDAATIERYRAEARERARLRLEDFATRTGLAQGSWEACVVEGEAPRAIIEQAHARHCDLIVLGKHGSSATQDLFLGSVTREVLADGTTDVLVSTQRAE